MNIKIYLKTFYYLRMLKVIMIHVSIVLKQGDI